MATDWAKCCLGMGSNVGNREGYLSAAISYLENLGEIREVVVSSWYETEAVGPGEQGDYLNLAVTLSTTLSPTEMLGLCQQLESQAGRESVDDREHWGPRTLDVDLLLYNERVMDETTPFGRLSVPHPRMHERWFVLKPLSDIAGDWQHPVLLQSIHQLLEIVERDRPVGQ